MRKLFAFLCRPVVWSTGTLLLLMSALHVVCPLLRIADDQRWLIELLAFSPLAVLLAGYWLRQFLIERRLATDMAAQAQKQAHLQGPDALRDFKAFSEEFKSAFAQLNQTCRERGQVGGASALPWIMILGPSGVGKSTALERSGLRFVSLGRRLQGIGGTRNCTWWLASDAVFLDTAGRYAVRDEDRDEWRAFLQLLRRRRQRPIDAVLLQVGIDELLDRPRAEVERAALQLRERLDELLHLLDAQIPVHLLLNKCDLIDGFTQFFGALSEEEKAKPWGFRLDVHELVHQSIGEAFQQRFGELVQALTQRTTARLLTLSDRDPREAVLTFPSELAAAGGTLRFFVETLFEARARTERPWLCAVHLGSAEQPGQHLMGLRHKRAEELGLPNVRRSSISQPRGQSGDGETMFLRGVFSQVLRQAEISARPSAARQLRLRLHQKIAVAAGLALCFLGSLYLGGGYTRTLVWMSQLYDGVKRMQEADSLPSIAARASKEELTAELARQEVVRELILEAPSGVPSGPMQEASVLLRRRIQRELLLPLQTQMKGDLERAAQRQQDGPGEDYTRGFGMLRLLYVLRGNSCEGTEPELTNQSLSQFILEHWQRALGDGGRFLSVTGDEEDPQRPLSANLRLRQELLFYFEQEPAALRAESVLPLDDTLRQRAGAALASGGDSAVIFNLRASLSNLYERDKPLQSTLFSEPGIERAFTKRGCSVFFSAEASRDSNWWKCVLSVPVPKDPPNLEEMYRERYTEAWNRWLHELKLRPVTTKEGATLHSSSPLGEVIEKLDELAKGARPALPDVIQTVGKGFDLTAHRAKQNRHKRTWYSGCGKSVQKSVDWGRDGIDQLKTPTQCKLALELLAPMSQLASKEKPQSADGAETDDGSLQEEYKKYLDSVKALRTTLYRIEKSTERTAEALKLVQATMAGSGDLWTMHTARDSFVSTLQVRLTSSHFELQDSGLQAALRDLEGMAWQALLPLAARSLNDQWKSQVYAPWQTVKGNLQRQNANDEERCKGRTDFLRDKLTGFVDKSLAMFFLGNSILDCTQKKMQSPFEQALPFLSATCGLLREARRVGAEITDCPKALGAGGGVPKRDIQNVDVIPPKTMGCNKDADEVILDRGDKVFACQVATGNCAESKIKSTQRAVLRVKWKESPSAAVILQSDYPEELFKKAQSSGSTLRFPVPKAFAPGACEGYFISFTLAPAAGGGGGAVPKRADDRWRYVELPENLVGLQR